MSLPMSVPRRRAAIRACVVALLVALDIIMSGGPATIAAGPSSSASPSAAAPAPVSPSPDASVVASGDSRSDEQGPGITGQPLVIFVGVIALGIAASAATLLAIRFTRDG